MPPPKGADRLVLGHESLAEVAEDGHGFAKGDLVSATVRRSCGHCLACGEGAPDSCLTGDYSERGITRLDGFARELVVEDPEQLVPVPRSLGRLAVLAEPTSICARGVRHALAIGGRQPWELKRALVIGAGAIGLLSAMLLRLEGVDVCVASLEQSNDIVDALCGRHVSTECRALRSRRLRPRRRGRRQRAADGRFARSSPEERVVCLLGIDGRSRKVELDGSVVGVDTVLENRVLFGSVNAHREDWLAGVDALDEARRRFPGALEELIGLRVPLERFGEAFAFHGGKATLVLQE